MKPLDFAMSLIRSPLAQKIKDKTFQVLIGTAVAATTGTVAAWQTSGLSVADKLNVTFACLAAWAAVGSAFTVSDKKKDAAIAAAAIQAAGSDPAPLAEK